MNIFFNIRNLFRWNWRSNTSHITKGQHEILSTQSPTKLCEWYCILNTFGWIEELGAEPLNTKKKDLINEVLRYRIMRWIESIVGEKAVSKYWNTKFRNTMSESDFEIWWSLKGDVSAQFESIKKRLNHEIHT